jgi:predicted dehydrogenase
MDTDMKIMPISPVVVGRGMAGNAILQSLSIVSNTDRDLEVLPVRLVERGTPLRSYLTPRTSNVLFLANPSGLHAKFLADGAEAGFCAILVDKPVCVLPHEIGPLRRLSLPVSVYHGYRTMWGTRTVKKLIESGELGEVFAFESRYWQSSSTRAAMKGPPSKRAWKNDEHLNGPWDALTDLGSHIVDICLYLMADKPIASHCWITRRNAAAAHRDTHVHLQLKFPDDRRAFASISKTVHGATNDLEYTVIGTRGAATWRFLQPDEVAVGSGNRISLLRRETPNVSSGTLPFHAFGWIEGYVDITRQTLRRLSGFAAIEVPTLKESLDVMDILLNVSLEQA